MPIMLITTLYVCHPTGERTGRELEWDRKKVVPSGGRVSFYRWEHVRTITGDGARGPHMQRSKVCTDRFACLSGHFVSTGI